MTHSLQRFTTEYIDSEDRIRLSGDVGNELVVVIWLTQRLLQRLLPMLWQWLESQNADMPHAEMLHGFAQQAAKAELTQQTPVLAVAESSAWLAQAVDIVQSEQAVSLTFRGVDSQGEVTLTLEIKALRQWLNILYDAYLKAEWGGLDVWPVWLRESGPSSSMQAVVLQ